MIVRFQVLIPFLLFVEAGLGDEAAPQEITVGDLTALIYPPHRSQLTLEDLSSLSQTAISDIPRKLDPEEPQPPAQGVQIGGGRAIVGDVLRIDFHKAEFDRRNGSEDPPTELAFRLANSWIQRLRTLNRVGWAKPIDKNLNPWSMTALNDDQTIVDRAEGYWRGRLGAAFQLQYTSLDGYGWNAINSLSVDYKPQPSDELLLDAYALLPQVGPAIVLAYTAIETRISHALDQLASLTGLNPTLWEWLNHRNDLTKNPSTGEQFDVVIKALSGKTLKEDSLWEKFQNLRRARNSFVHEGKVAIGGRAVEPTQAVQLVQSAEQIIDWIENLLPQSERRPRAESPNHVVVTRLIVSPPGTPADEQGRPEQNAREGEFRPETDTNQEA